MIPLSSEAGRAPDLPTRPLSPLRSVPGAACLTSASHPRQKYVENVKQDTHVGFNILRVSASDEDADNNGVIVYNLTAPQNPSDLDYFSIQPDSGWITLQKPLDVSAAAPLCVHGARGGGGRC